MKLAASCSSCRLLSGPCIPLLLRLVWRRLSRSRSLSLSRSLIHSFDTGLGPGLGLGPSLGVVQSSLAESRVVSSRLSLVQ